VSARTGDSVDSSFLAVVKAAAQRGKEDEPMIPDTLKLDSVKPKAEAGCAC